MRDGKPGFALDGYVEVHIEQGPRLENEHKTIGVVTGIQGSRRYIVEVNGEEAHAGTTPRAARKDAFAAATRIAAAMYEATTDAQDTLRFTIGRVEVYPGSPNTVPSKASFTVDMRHPSDAALEAHEKTLLAIVAARAAPCTARIDRVTAPLAISHQEQFPAYTISFDLAQGQSLDEAVGAIAQAESEIRMPDSITGSFSGEAAEFRTSLAGQPWLILAAVVAIYIVLGVLYESYVHPLTILSTLPSAGIGALVALLTVGEHLTIIGVIGIILLMGIVKKNAIMMIDFAIDAERRAGRSPERAIVEACRLRFRPIMMTTLAALFGALPLAMAKGPGAELRLPLGVSIIGGLLLSQILTLYTTPVIYLALDGMRRRLVARWRQSAEEAPGQPGDQA